MREIQPINNHGSIQLKFSHGGQRYNFHPIPGGQFNCTKDLATVKSIAVRIQNDILAGYFDTSLNKYRLAPKKPDAISKVVEQPKILLEVFDLWMTTLTLTPQVKNTSYIWLRRDLEKTQPTLTDTSWLTKSRTSLRTRKVSTHILFTK